MHDDKKENNKCVKVNIFVKCNGECRKKKENEETCVEVNIHVDCEGCKERDEDCKGKKNPRLEI